MVDQTVHPVWGEVTLQVSFFGAWGLLLISGRLSSRRAAMNPKPEGVACLFHHPFIVAVLWRCPLGVRSVDPGGDAVYLDSGRGSQQHQIGSLPPWFKVGSTVASDVDEVPNLELVRHL